MDDVVQAGLCCIPRTCADYQGVHAVRERRGPALASRGIICVVWCAETYPSSSGKSMHAAYFGDL
jgi:hypothetical protein